MGLEIKMKILFEDGNWLGHGLQDPTLVESARHNEMIAAMLTQAIVAGDAITTPKEVKDMYKELLDKLNKGEI